MAQAKFLPNTFISLDLEMNQPSGHIIQVGVVVGAPGQPESEFEQRQWLLSPGEPLAEHIIALTGITEDELAARAVPWEQMASELAALVLERQPFINPVTWGGGDAELLVTGIRGRGIDFPHFGRRWIDVKTLASLDAFAAGRSPAGGLSSVMRRYKLPFVGTAHRADVDAFNTLRLFFRLLDQRKQLNALVDSAKAM